MSQRRKRVFSQAVQDLFGGDGMVEDSGPLSFEDWERIVRQMQDNLSAYVGDRKKARRILLDGPRLLASLVGDDDPLARDAGRRQLMVDGAIEHHADRGGRLVQDSVGAGVGGVPGTPGDQQGTRDKRRDCDPLAP